MGGLQDVLKIHGEIHAGDVIWVWDYTNGCPKKKSEMTKSEYRKNKKLHKEKGQIKFIGDGNIEWGKR